MGRFFAIDSPVMRVLSRIGDLMILNILVLITCMPVITIGASLSALHYVLIKMSKDEETYIFKMYFKSFKENFVQGTILWVIVFVIGLFFAVDIYIFVNGEQSGMVFPWVVIVGVFAIAVLFLMSAMYVFPLQARFVNTIGQTLKNSFFMMILNFPKSIAMLLLYSVPIILFLLSSFATPFLIMFGVSAPSFGAVYLYKKVFSRFEPEPEAITSDLDFTVITDDSDITEESSIETNVEG